jgi:hypothetical protein
MACTSTSCVKPASFLIYRRLITLNTGMLDEDELYRIRKKSWASLSHYPTVCSELLTKNTNKTQSGYWACGQTTQGKTGFQEVLTNTKRILVCCSCHSVFYFTDKYRYITTKCYRFNKLHSASPVTVSYSMAYIHRRMVGQYFWRHLKQQTSSFLSLFLIPSF